MRPDRPLQQPRQRRLRPGTCAGAVLVAAVAAWQFLGNLDGEPFFPDEQSLVAQSYYWKLYRGQAPAVPRRPWNHTDWLRYAAYDHPPLIKYMIGLGMDVGGAPVPDDLGDWFAWLGGDYARPKGLYWARLPVALCGVAGCLAFFGIGVLARGRLVGLAAALLLAANPLFFTLSRRAMRDVPAEAFVLLAVLLCCWLWPRLFAPASSGPVERKRRPTAPIVCWLVVAALAGSLGAFATLTRLTGAMALVLVAAILLLAATAALAARLLAVPDGNQAEESHEDTYTKPVPLLRALAVVPGLALIAAVSAGVAWLLNPFLHAHPSAQEVSAAVREARQLAQRRPGAVAGIALLDARLMPDLAERGFWGRLRWLPEYRMQWRREALRNERFDRFDDWRLRTIAQRIRAVVWQGFGRYSLFGCRRRGWHHELEDPDTKEKLELFYSCLWPHRHADRGRPGVAVTRTFPCLWPALVFLPLTLWGLACMARDGWKALRARRPPVVWGAALYVAANIGSVPLYIPWAWDRYFLPVVAASTLAIAYGIAAMLRWFGGLFVLRPPGA